MARLQKYARLGKGKGKGIAQPSGAAVPPVAPARVPAPSAAHSSRATVRHEAPREDRPREDRPREDRPRVDRPREDRPRAERPREDRHREDRPAGRHDARPSRPREEPSSPESSIHRAMVAKFSEQLSVEVAESSRRSDHIEAIADSTAGLIRVSMAWYLSSVMKFKFIEHSSLFFFFFFFFLCSLSTFSSPGALRPGPTLTRQRTS